MAVLLDDPAAPERPMRALVASPAWRWWVLACLLARLPVTMQVFGLVLAGRHLGSYGLGAALAATATISSGSAAWWRGRALDRVELRGGLARDTAIAAVAYAAVAALVAARAPAAPVFVLVALGGVATSAVFAAHRSILTEVVEPALVAPGYAVDAILVEVGFVLGPALAGGIAALVGPVGVLVAMSAFAAVATLATLTRLPLRPPVPVEGDDPAPPPWRDGEARANYLACAAVGVAVGLIESGFAPFAEHLGASRDVGGLLSAAYALGSGVGGVLFATRMAGRPRPGRRAVVLLAVIGALLLPIGLAPGALAAGLVLFVAGLPFATANASASTHLRLHVHPARATEGFALAATAVMLGVGLGQAVAAVLLAAEAAPPVLYLASGAPPALAAAAIALWAARRREAPAPAPVAA